MDKVIDFDMNRKKIPRKQHAGTNLRIVSISIQGQSEITQISYEIIPYTLLL